MILDATEPSKSTPHRELASAAEMKFAGQYLNICGVLLFMMGLVSYLKSSGTSSGAMETGLGYTLGFTLLLAGEYFFIRGMRHYSQALLTLGAGLLFLVACSGHFRHSLYLQTTLFVVLLAVVIFSNVSVFRYNSKLLGHTMLVVYFATPIALGFKFHNFMVIFLYLFAINLGSVLVAFYKKWDFQILVSSLGSYAFYFAYFREANPISSLYFLLAVYGLYLIANNLLYFIRPSASPYNLVLSMINPVVFACLATLINLGLPNWLRVSVYGTLALCHGFIFWQADVRRKRGENFPPLATNSLVLCLLFVCASISFVPYFSETTSYFGLTTFLWGALAIVLAGSAIFGPRYGKVLAGFSYFAILLASAQILFVLPTMTSSAYLQVLSLTMMYAYLALFWCNTSRLSSAQKNALPSLVWVTAVITGSVIFSVTQGLATSLVLTTTSTIAISMLSKLWEKSGPLASIHLWMAGATYALWSNPITQGQWWLASAFCLACFGFALIQSKQQRSSALWLWPLLQAPTLATAQLLAPYPMATLLLAMVAACVLASRAYNNVSVAILAVLSYQSLFNSWAEDWLFNLLALTLLPLGFAYLYYKFDDPRQKGFASCLGILSFVKFTALFQIGPFATLSWTVLAFVTLAVSETPISQRRWIYLEQGLFDWSRFLFFIAFIKAITFDAHYTGALQGWHYPLAFLTSFVFLATAHLLIRRTEVRDFFVVLGLLTLCFQLTFLAHGLWGDRLIFQPVLSGFWSGAGFLIVVTGLSLNAKVYRLFGLTTLVANTAKVLLVDIHVLDSYSQTNTYLILGSLLMMTSFLYQRNRQTLCAPEQLAPVPT